MRQHLIYGYINLSFLYESQMRLKYFVSAKGGIIYYNLKILSQMRQTFKSSIFEVHLKKFNHCIMSKFPNFKQKNTNFGKFKKAVFSPFSK